MSFVALQLIDLGAFGALALAWAVLSIVVYGVVRWVARDRRGENSPGYYRGL